MENKLVNNNKCEFDNNIAKIILEKLLERVKVNQNDKEFLARPFTIESFYKSFDNDIELTVENLVSCIIWRNKEYVEGIEKYYDETGEAVVKFINKKNNIPVIYISSFYGSDDIKSLIFHGTILVEKMLKQKKYTTYDLIFDFYKPKMSHYTDIIGIKYFINIFKKYYPYRINKLILINANHITYNLVNICTPFMSGYMKGRVFPIKDYNIELVDYYDQKILDFLNELKKDSKNPLVIANDIGLN